MTRPRTTNERVAVVEEKIDRLEEVFANHHRDISAKLDLVIGNQQTGAADRADMKREMSSIKQDVAGMKPHVETVAHAKTFWSWAGKIGAALTAIGAAGWGLWSVLKQYFTLRGH